MLQFERAEQPAPDEEAKKERSFIFYLSCICFKTKQNENFILFQLSIFQLNTNYHGIYQR